MRCYLSPYEMGVRFDELVEFLGPGANVAVISNALDYIDPEARRQYRGFNAVDCFRNRGLTAFDVDLRDYFNSPQALHRELLDSRLIWAVGGNAFLLRRAMRQSGLDDLVVRRISEGSLTYGGWSAGACVAGASLRGIHLMDDPPLAPAGYEPEVIWEGMGLVASVIVPHYDSDHAESASANSAVEWLRQAGLPFQTLRDGEVIVC